jgi:hypothetical protein
MNVTTTSGATALQFGIYRDGDNNLDEIQSPVLDQAFQTSRRDPSIAFDVEDFTAREDAFSEGHEPRTESYSIRGGNVEGSVTEARPSDPSSRATLARFVAHTLDEAQRNGARQTWIDLVDHGGGDGGGLQNHLGKVMPSDEIAGAIADGIALHAQEHPEDASRRLDGVVANQCLMATVSFASALSHVGVKFLAASPETMLAPGTPTTVAEAIAQHGDDPEAMARAMVTRTMHARYGLDGQAYAPAAAFDVLDLAPQKIAAMEHAVGALDATIARDAKDDGVRGAVLEDARSVEGMVRFTRQPYPWHADRPAEALYDTFARDTRLPDDLRAAAASAKDAVSATVLAHAESRGFAAFGGASYRDSAGPTVHFATNHAERDPWAPQISETKTAFDAKVGEKRLDRALGTA